jgi:hypothetical protein
MIGRIVTMVALCSVMYSRAACQGQPSGVIVPGKSVAGVRLGSSLKDFRAVFPDQPNLGGLTYEHMSYGSSYQWVDLAKEATGVFVYLRDNKIYQLRVQTPRFAVASGVKLGDFDEGVKRCYPTGQGYVVLRSDATYNGGRDLRYWVDQQSGIAFELSWQATSRRWRVSSIDIFAPGTNYEPEGGVLPPQRWLKGGWKDSRSAGGLPSQ